MLLLVRPGFHTPYNIQPHDTEYAFDMGKHGLICVLACYRLVRYLGVRGETPRGTESGDARAWQGATREQIGYL